MPAQGGERAACRGFNVASWTLSEQVNNSGVCSLALCPPRPIPEDRRCYRAAGTTTTEQSMRKALFVLSVPVMLRYSQALSASKHQRNAFWVF